MKKVLITGCSGYIGSHLCKALENDYDVWGLDLFPPQAEIKEGQFIQHDIIILLVSFQKSLIQSYI